MLNFKFCKQCGKLFYRNEKYSDGQWKNCKCCSRSCGAITRDVSKDKEICDRYLDGDSTKNIAKDHNTSDTNIRRILHKYDVEMSQYKPKVGAVYVTEDGYIRFHETKYNGALAGRRLHDIILEMKIRRPMKRNEVCHHINKNKFDNSPDNLEVMTRSDHTIHHLKERGRYSGWVDGWADEIAYIMSTGRIDISSVCGIFSMSRTYYYSMLKKSTIKHHNMMNEIEKCRSNLSLQEIEKLRSDGMTFRQIGKLHNYSRKTISKRLKEIKNV